MGLDVEKISITASDGYMLGATVYRATESTAVLIINGATAVPQGFYRRFAEFIRSKGITVITYDFRGMGESAPQSLKAYAATCSDWGLLDIPAVLKWTKEYLKPESIYFVGHSAGGQQAGLLEDASSIDAMVTISAQSGYWRLQGGNQKLAVWLSTYILIPLSIRLFGYFPWSKLGSAMDLPRNVASQWAKWCRHPKYILGDSSLPLERYKKFVAPVLAYSIDDDDWGTATAVDAMMLEGYPNVERRHIVPAEYGIKKMAHMGFFRQQAEPLWSEVYSWLSEKNNRLVD